jgi:GTP-binding protein HflX
VSAARGGESHTELDKRKIRDRIAELQLEIVAMECRAQDAARPSPGTSGPQVGFIKNLPHGLVASFKSTLDEALDASLLLHVIDASDPGFERQLEVTDHVLAEIGADEVPRIRVFNKIDHVGDAAAQAECEAALRAKYPDCVVMSARRPEEVAALRLLIIAFFQQGLIEDELFLPWTAQQLRKDIYADCEVLEERADEAGAFFRVRGEGHIVTGLREKFEAL